MRKIERDMLAAITSGKDWHSANTMVVHSDHVGNPYLRCSVYLHGHVIAEIDRGGVVHALHSTFRHWPTRTTASRLRALGVDARLIKHEATINGVTL